MSDNEITKALECCANEGFQDCENCPLNIPHQPCSKVKLPRISLDLVNRQKTEINRLNNELHGKVEYIHEQLEIIDEKKAEIASYERIVLEWDDKLTRVIEGLPLKFNSLKTEAIKEFAEKLKDKYSQADILCPRRIISITEKGLDDFVKEMVGEQE